MPNVMMLPHVIEKKLKVEERREVIDFINELLVDTSDELKKDVIEIVGERFERKAPSPCNPFIAQKTDVDSPLKSPSITCSLRERNTTAPMHATSPNGNGPSQN